MPAGRRCPSCGAPRSLHPTRMVFADGDRLHTCAACGHSEWLPDRPADPKKKTKTTKKEKADG